MDKQTLDQIRDWLGTGSINIFGRPFAGKDTQGSELVRLFEATLLGGGDILRNSSIPARVNEALKRGELIPSSDYVDIVLPYLSKTEFADTPLILSSVGRWIGEETGVIEALDAANHPLKAVIYLSLEESTVMQRWRSLGEHNTRSGRADDTEQILEKRLKEYNKKTIPVVEAYDSMGLLIRINGNQAPAVVTNEIITALARRADEK